MESAAWKKIQSGNRKIRILAGNVSKPATRVALRRKATAVNVVKMNVTDTYAGTVSII
jgi:hypothetical protein